MIGCNKWHFKSDARGAVVVYFRCGRQTRATKQRTSLTLSVFQAVCPACSLRHIIDWNTFFCVVRCLIILIWNVAILYGNICLCDETEV
jgi:hypothetical protein